MKPEEWHFAEVPDTELDACFYYEFSRSTDLIKRGVQAWRKSFPGLTRAKIAWFNAPTDSWLPGASRHSDEAEFVQYRVAMLEDEDANAAKPKSLSLIKACLLDFVVSFKEFPNQPWKLIKDSPIKRKSAKEWSVPDGTAAAQNPGLCLSDLTRKLFEWQEMDFSAWESIEAMEHHQSNVAIKLTHHLFGLSWNYRNSDLESAFAKWLTKNRPAQFPEPKHHRSVTGFGWQRLPFRKKNALEWLGVLRRRNSVATWRQYFSLYKGQAFIRGAERVHEEDCRKARLILDWFGNGTPFRKQDFK